MRFLILIFLSLINFSYAGGGVDVGNFYHQVPGSNLNILIPKIWKINIVKDSIEAKLGNQQRVLAKLYHPHSKTILSSRELVEELNALGAKEVYQEKMVNGLSGAYYLSKDQLLQKVFVISPTHEIVTLVSETSSSSDREAHSIANTIYFKYQGVAAKNTKEFTVTLFGRDQSNYESSTVSFNDGCRYDSCSNTSSTLGEVYLRDLKMKMNIGLSGYDTGKIVDLNLNREDFKKIEIKKDYLVLPFSNVRLDQIYDKFSPHRPIANLSSSELIEGHVYLIRTISWPKEDALFKMVVNSINQSDSSISLTIKKLAYVPTKELQQNIDFMNKYTLEFEAKQTQGEVTLYDRQRWAGEYSNSVFNFKYGTRDNQFITMNSWDLLFDGGKAPHFSYAGSWSDRGDILDLGDMDLEKVDDSAFPLPLQLGGHPSIDIIKGHTYLVMSYDLGSIGATWSAINITEIEPAHHRWVKFKWKKILSTDFQDPFIFSLKEFSSNSKVKSLKTFEDFNPIIDFYDIKNQCYFNSVTFDGQNLSYSSSLSGGHYKYTGNWDTLNLKNFDSKKLVNGKIPHTMNDISHVNKNQMYIINLKSFWDEIILGIRIISTNKQNVTFQYKILSFNQDANSPCEILK